MTDKEYFLEMIKKNPEFRVNTKDPKHFFIVNINTGRINEIFWREDGTIKEFK